MNSTEGYRYRFRLRHCCVVVLFLAAVVGAVQPAHAQYDPTASFSASSNPNGVWTYGYEEVPLGSAFHLLSVPIPVASVPGPTIDSWQTPAFGTLGVLHNGTALTQTVATSADNAIYDPGMLALHPGPNDQWAIVQFTAPTNGFYSIKGTFEGIDTAWTSSTVALLFNNSIIASTLVFGFGPAFEVPISSGPKFLAAGDTLAYAVGGGPFHDTTALINASISPVAVPEPSSCVLLGIGCVALAARGWRKRKGAA